MLPLRTDPPPAPLLIIITQASSLVLFLFYLSVTQLHLFRTFTTHPLPPPTGSDSNYSVKLQQVGCFSSFCSQKQKSERCQVCSCLFARLLYSIMFWRREERGFSGSLCRITVVSNLLLVSSNLLFYFMHFVGFFPSFLSANTWWAPFSLPRPLCVTWPLSPPPAEGAKLKTSRCIIRTTVRLWVLSF